MLSKIHASENAQNSAPQRTKYNSLDLADFWQVLKHQMLGQTCVQGAPEYHACLAIVLWQPSALNRCPLLKTRQDMYATYFSLTPLKFSATKDTVDTSKEVGLYSPLHFPYIHNNENDPFKCKRLLLLSSSPSNWSYQGVLLLLGLIQRIIKY